MGKKIILLGALDQHPERLAKLPKFLSVFLATDSSIILFSAVCPPEFREAVEWVEVKSRKRNRQKKWRRLIDTIREEIHLAALLGMRGRHGNQMVSLRRYVIPALLGRFMGLMPIRYHAGPSYKVQSSGAPNAIAEWVASHAYSRIVVPSPTCVRQFYLEHSLRKISIGPFNIEETFFRPTFTWSSRRRAIGYFGNLTVESDGYRAVDRLVTAFMSLRRWDPSLNLILGGVGPLEERLRKESPEGIILTGWLSHDEVRDWLDRIQLLVLPSVDEGLATVLLQAMARGTPVLATSVAGNPDVIVDKQTGFLMESTRPSCIARNIRRALEDPSLQEVAENGRRLVEQQYSFRAVVKGWQQILDAQGSESIIRSEVKK